MNRYEIEVWKAVADVEKALYIHAKAHIEWSSRGFDGESMQLREPWKRVQSALNKTSEE
jgi:hypothetical protein